jgi:hypothetical protein
MKKTETRHRPYGQGFSQRMGGMFTVNHAGIAQKMNLDERKDQEKAEITTDLIPQLGSHSGVRYISFQCLSVNGRSRSASPSLSVMPLGRFQYY